MTFRDMLYGEIKLPDWLDQFLRLPEFLRLRGVRLSNVDSIQYKDFGSATRYDHAIGVAHLANVVGSKRKLRPEDSAHLILAALLHDVGTPPFGHTLELVFDDVDHELEAWNALGLDSETNQAKFNAVDGELPQFYSKCRLTSGSTGIQIRPEWVGDLINGNGELGFFIKGTIDLDNIDNVIRGSHYMGLKTTNDLAIQLAEWLATLDSQPTLEGNLPGIAKEWITLRNEYYRLFYDCSTEEESRQSLLQFLIRESHRLGMSKLRLLKSTDAGLINAVSVFADEAGVRGKALSDALHKYKTLESMPKVGEIHLEDPSIISVYKLKLSITWTEEHLRKPGFVPVLLFGRRRFPETMIPNNSLFGYPPAKISIFSLYAPNGKPRWPATSAVFPDFSEVRDRVLSYAITRPWTSFTPAKRDEVVDSLASWGNWAFMGSRNESMHAYPSTFVHAIPAALIKSLSLAGDLIIDPFCGSGVTAVEAAKAGCTAICADVNEVALLITRVRTSFLDDRQRSEILSISQESLEFGETAHAPEIDNLDKWHRPETTHQLCNILGYISSVSNPEVSDFLKLAFSSILTATTARRGREHQYFADNTPLARDETGPPRVDAYALFLARIRKNIALKNKIYAEIQRKEEDVAQSLARIRVVKTSARDSATQSYGLAEGTVGGIITSPPYLAMSDYTLGHRLSYAWLWPAQMGPDFNQEIGARRRRFKTEAAISEYFDDLKSFAGLSHKLLREGGFLATVVGAPQAQRFSDVDVLRRVDETVTSQGLRVVWQTDRPISWHRNHGLAQLKTERLTLYVKS